MYENVVDFVCRSMIFKFVVVTHVSLKCKLE